MPRPTDLNEELQKTICKYIRMGLSQDDAAICSGISDTCLYNWKKRGKEEGEGIYFEFVEALKKAKTESKAYSLAEIQKAAAGGQEIIEEKTVYGPDGKVKEKIITKKLTPKQWQPHAWRLERMWPDEFGRKDRHEITGAAGDPIEVKMVEHKSKGPITH